jgi:hypothetical protein
MENSGDNNTRTLTGNGTYSFSPVLVINLFAKYREKIFDHNASANYKNYSVVPNLKIRFNHSYSGGILLGTNRYSYTEKNDIQTKFVAKIYGRGYFINQRLVSTASYQVQSSEKEHIERKKNKKAMMAGAAYRFDLPFIYKLTGRINYGDQDTKDNDAQDYDYDYTAINYYLRGDIKIQPDIKTNIAWQKFGKDYLSYQRDHQGYSLNNGWDYYPIKDKIHSIWFNIDIGYKSVTYTDNPESGYDKELVGLKVNYRRISLWKISCLGTANFYQYKNSYNDKGRYNCYLSWEKNVLSHQGLLTIDLKYRYNHYIQQANSTSLGMRIGLSYNL